MKLWGIFLLSCIIYGCDIYEGIDPCPVDSGETLIFRYYADGDRDVFGDKIGEVTLYIYDNRDGSLVETIIPDSRQLQDQRIQLDLGAGSYHAVAWGNFQTKTTAENTGNVSTGIVGVTEHFTRETITTSDSLYFGKLDFVIPENAVHTDTLVFNSAHINMVLDLVDLKDEAIVEGVSPISFRVSEISPMVDFHGIVSDEKAVYFPVTHAEGDDFVARFNTLRFDDVNDVRIDLYYGASAEPMYTLDLASYMADNDITVDGINEVTIGIRFIFTGTTVVVEEWVENVITPGF